MPARNTQTFVVILLLFFFLVAILFFINPRFSLDSTLFVFGAILIFLLTFFNTDAALVILIFSMLLSPELKVGAVSSREVIIRIEDLLLLVVFFGWLAKMAMNKEMGILRTTALNKPILFYTFICLFSTSLGIFQGYLNLKSSFFFLLKYFEYFLLFFMVANNLDSIKKAKTLVFFILLTCLIVSAYGWLQIPSGARVSTPFEGREGEPNTYAGYMILMMGVILGLTFHLPRYRLPLFGFTAFIFVPFLLTLSRGSWVAFFPMLLTIVVLSRKFRIQIILLLLSSFILVLVDPHIIPKRVHSRVDETFTPGKTYEVFGNRVTVDESTSERIESWRKGIEKVAKRPFFGNGVPDAAVIDNQYIRVLRETGIIGFLAFFWLITKIFGLSLRVYKSSEDDNFVRGLSLGFLAGYVGILAHGVSAATFIIIRIMEPFWFLAAIVVALPDVLAQEAQTSSPA